MKPERAQELYSAYLENDLSPAMKLAMEQHLESDPTAREDLDDFARMMDVIHDYAEEIDPPSGFRAKVMELATIEDAKRRAANAGGIARLRQFFLLPRRREVTAVLATALSAAVIAGIFLKPVPPGASNTAPVFAPTAPGQGSVTAPANAGSLIPLPATNQAAVPNAVITGVTVRTGSDGTMYHDIGVRLSDDIKHAAVSAYSITATQQILDPGARERDSAPLLNAGEEMTGGTNITIAVPLTQQAPAGSTLNVLVEWRPDQAGATSGAQVVFTPMNPGDAAAPLTTPPSNGNFFNLLQTIASAYHVTVIADATTAPITSVPVWQPGDNVMTALRTIARPAGYDVKPLAADTFYVYRETSAQ